MLQHPPPHLIACSLSVKPGQAAERDRGQGQDKKGGLRTADALIKESEGKEGKDRQDCQKESGQIKETDFR